MTSYEAALELTKGYNIDRIKLNDPVLVRTYLTIFRDNCNIVLKQFKKDGLCTVQKKI